MPRGDSPAARRLLHLGLASLPLLALVVGCQTQRPSASPLEAPAPSTQASATAAALKLLRTSPETGPVGTVFTVAGSGLPAGRSLEFRWDTVDGSYTTELVDNKPVFGHRSFTPTRISLGTATVDAKGNVEATLSVPEDYGEVHDIYAVLDGVEVAKGGFFVTRSFELSPTSGPVGTPMTLTVRGLGIGPLTSTMAVRYDNTYTGWISATTTRGTARAQFRAAGPVGEHLIEAIPASHLTPYMNNQQSSVSHLVTFREWFTTTEDDGPPSPELDWPDPGRVGRPLPAPALSSPSAVGGTVALLPDAGPVGTTVAIDAAGLPGGAQVDLVWITATRSDLYRSNTSRELLGEATVSPAGNLQATVQVPDSLGGSHAVWVMQGEEVLAHALFLVERSLYGLSPTTVRMGETYTVHLKGAGWGELDNGVAVTYDNAFLGYGCGFSSNGDLTLYLVATGGVGTHLIDLYPMIYDSGDGGSQSWPWQYNMPQLTALEDHPSLGLGYRLPTFRLAIEVVP